MVTLARQMTFISYMVSEVIFFNSLLKNAACSGNRQYVPFNKGNWIQPKGKIIFTDFVWCFGIFQ